MKNFLITFILLPFLITASLAQTQPNLPNGSKPFSSNIYLSPNSDLWTGKPGTYINFAKKRYVDSLVSNIGVSTTSLKINYPTNQSNVFRVPSSTPDGLNLIDGGHLTSYVSTGVGINSIPLRSNGRIQVSNAVLDLDAVNLYQLNNNVTPVYASFSSFLNFSESSQIRFSNNSNLNRSRMSTIQFSDGSTIENPTNTSNTYRNLISNSFNSTISGDIVQHASIIGSREVKIGKNRIQSAIIASTQSEIKDYVTGAPGFAKWNSAIIAGLLCTIGESNSYTFVTGRGNHSAGSATFICGRYNVKEPMISVDNPLKKTFVVGAGTGIENDEDTGDESLITRKNAFYVTHGGRAWVQQELEVDAAGKGLVLKSPDGSRWSISINNSGVLTSTKLP